MANVEHDHQQGAREIEMKTENMCIILYNANYLC